MSVSNWAALMGVLTVEVALVFMLALLFQRWTQSGVWRRTLWQACIFALALLVVAELSGVARGVASLVSFRRDPAPNPERRVGPSQNAGPPVQLSEDFRRRVQERVVLNREEIDTQTAPLHSPGSSPQTTTPTSAPINLESSLFSASRAQTASEPQEASRRSLAGRSVWWPGIVWLLGAAAFGMRTVFIRLLLLVFRARYRAPADAALQERVRFLAKRMGIRRAIQMKEFPRIAAPVAFGVCWPTIGLPPGFTKNFSGSQQEAVLAHELAHLAARDPLWHALADLVVAAVWWHPLAWLARRQLQAANESAADEASVVVADGPKVLAECLVQLGGRLMTQQSVGWLNMAGFRSDLGNRVEHLVNLPVGTWSPPSRFRAWLARTAGPAALVATGIFCTAWMTPSLPNQPQMKSEHSMKTIKQYWLGSVANAALVAALGVDNGLFAQTKPDEPKTEQGIQNAPPSSRTSDALRRRYGLPPAAANEPPSVAEEPGGPTAPPLQVQEMSEMFRRRYGIPPAGGYPTQMSLEMAKRYGLLSQAPSPRTGNPRMIQDKLASIRLDEVVFDGLPLQEVAKFLFEESKKRDPDHQGINFLITNNADTPPAAIDPTTGLPMPPTPPEADLNSVTVAFNLPLRNVRLVDVLNAIVRVADKPVKYSVEEFGVVFSPDTQSSRRPNSPPPMVAEAEPLKVRTFKVDPTAFLQGLEGTFGIASPSTDAFNRNVNTQRKLELQLRDAEEMEGELTRKVEDKPALQADVEKARLKVAQLTDKIERFNDGMQKQRAEASVAVQETLLRLFNKLGVKLDAPKAVFYNPVTGIVMVKVSARDLEVVQAALETLGGNPISAEHSAWVRGFGGGAVGGRSVGGSANFGKDPVLGDLPTLPTTGRRFRPEPPTGDENEKPRP